MPTYEYRCRNCGHTFDIVQAMIDESLTVCPACGGELRKVFAPPAISFKGSGFYATDQRQKSKTEKAGEKTAASAESSDTKGEKKDRDKKESSQPAEKTAASSSTASSSSGSGSTGGPTSDGKSS